MLLTPLVANAATSISITTPSSGSTVTGSDFTVSGTATAARKISVKVNGAVVGTTTSDSGGNWSLGVTGQLPGTKTIEATASTEILYTNVLTLSGISNSHMLKINTLNDSQVGTFSIVSGGSPFTAWQANSLFTKAYGSAAELSSSNVFPVNLSNETVTNFTMAGALALPNAGAFNADNSKVYITDSNNDVVHVYNASTDAEIGAGIAVGDAPINTAKRPNSNQIWVLNTNADTASVIDTTTDTVTNTYSLGTGPADIDFSPDGSIAYISTDTVGDLYILNANTGANIQTINGPGTGEGQDILINPTGTRAYVANFLSNIVEVFNLESLTYETAIATNAGALTLAITSDGSKLYATLPNLGGGANGTTIAVINTSNNSVASTITTAGAPFFARMSPVESASTSISFTLADSDGLADTGENTLWLYVLSLATLTGGGFALRKTFSS